MEVVGRMSRDKSSQSFIFVLFFYGFITEILTECFKVHHTLDEALQNPHSHTHTHTHTQFLCKGQPFLKTYVYIIALK